MEFSLKSYVIFWRYKPKPGHETQFQQVYGSTGAWVKLFQKGQGYIGTLLLQEQEDSPFYLTVDQWESEAAYHHFMQQHQAEYQALDSAFEALTDLELLVGKYVIL